MSNLEFEKQIISVLDKNGKQVLIRLPKDLESRIVEYQHQFNKRTMRRAPAKSHIILALAKAAIEAGFLPDNTKSK